MEDELVGILSKLVEFVENASPVIWEAALKQVEVSIVRASMWAVVLTALAAALVYLTIRAARYGLDEDDDFIFPAFLVGCLATVSTGAVILLVSDLVGYILNPTYYAIQNILSLVQ